MNSPARIAYYTFVGSLATAAWWLVCIARHLPPSDGASGAGGVLLLGDPFVWMIAGPVAVISTAVVFPIAYRCLRDARLAPSVALVAIVVGATIYATVAIASAAGRAHPLFGFWPVYPATFVALLASSRLFEIEREEVGSSSLQDWARMTAERRSSEMQSEFD